MKLHTTNYKNTFIEVADDCPVKKGQIPSLKNKKTIANIQYDIIGKNPYKFTLEEVLFKVYAERNVLPKSEYQTVRIKLFSKGQAYLRSSPLTKRYGWGLHFDENRNVALFGRKRTNIKNLRMIKN